MRPDAQALVLAQWFSPAYPLGAFSWSHGLETAVAEGWVTDGPSLHDWIRDVLTCGSGRSDAVLLRLGHGAEARTLEALDAHARAYMASSERLAEADRQGAAFARTTARVWSLDLPPLLLPVAVGRAARLLDIDIDAAVARSLHAFANTLVSAAQRLMPLGQTEAQQILADLGVDCLEVASVTRGCTRRDLWGHAFLSDIAAMRHETQSVRLFQS